MRFKLTRYTKDSKNSFIIGFYETRKEAETAKLKHDLKFNKKYPKLKLERADDEKY